MLDSFFQLTPPPADQLIGSYDITLVILSYIVALGASYIALDITGRLRAIGTTPLGNVLWITGGAIAMGCGIWSMHFIGMLSFSIPNMPMYYDPFWTAASLFVAIAASGFALALLKSRRLPVMNLILGGLILGFAIASMHYTGMHAMSIHMNLKYYPGLFFLSIVIAIIASEAALWLAIKSNEVVSQMKVRLKIVSAIVMGAAICGMHYTGMAATVFMPMQMDMVHDATLNPSLLAVSIAGVTIIILGIAFFASSYKEALEQEMINTARQAGMAELAASVLHNVGNVLNSVNVSANILSEINAKSKLAKLQNVADLLEKHQENLANYLSLDPVGRELPKYIILLAEYWKNEKNEINDELHYLVKNVGHIRNIIGTQQDLSRIKSTEQFCSLDATIDEGLLITGIGNVDRYNIALERKYTHLKPAYIDKVKLLQIIINLMTNAKDALFGTEFKNKKIILELGLVNPKCFFIKVTDNGIGIHPSKLTRIFSYGFTTKEQGHGFGLHSSAISAKDMGGSIRAESEGEGKGSSFILELPYKTKP